MFKMKSRHLLNLSIQNALDCISENFNLKNFPGAACAQNSLENGTIHCPNGHYCTHIATVYYISRPPLSQNPPSTPGEYFTNEQQGIFTYFFVALIITKIIIIMIYCRVSNEVRLFIYNIYIINLL